MRRKSSQFISRRFLLTDICLSLSVIGNLVETLYQNLDTQIGETISADTQIGIDVTNFVSEDGKYIVELNRDKSIDSAWVELMTSADLLARFVSAFVKLNTFETIASCLYAAKAKSRRNILRLGLVNGSYEDDKSLEILESALFDDDVEIRAAATEALFILNWKSAIPIVDHAVKVEKDHGVKAMLTALNLRYSQ